MTKEQILILVSILIFLVIVILAIFLIVKNKKNKNYHQSKNMIIELVGGVDNIISYKAKMSRFELELKDYDIVDKDKLKDCGVQGIARTSQKITLIIGKEMASDLETALKKLIK